MKNPIKSVLAKVSPLSTKTKAGIATVSVVVLGATGVTLQQFATTGASDVPPIFEQVENHEGRINNLEGRADTTETKVEQNSADIQVIQQETGVTPAPTVTGRNPSQSTNPTSPSAPVVADPIPTPVPTPNPRSITAVSDVSNGNGTHSCDYDLFDARQNAKSGVYIQPDSAPCYKVGDVLPY